MKISIQLLDGVDISKVLEAFLKVKGETWGEISLCAVVSIVLQEVR